MLLTAAVATFAAPVKSAKAKTVSVKQENQFILVDEFVKAGRAMGTVVSVEGYIVVGYRTSDGGERLAITDSVDHVLSARDANGLAASGAIATAPASGVKSHAKWAWTSKGILRLVMYTGSGKAQKVLHDTVGKVRVSGIVSAKRTLGTVVKIEEQDDNGDWKAL